MSNPEDTLSHADLVQEILNLRDEVRQLEHASRMQRTLLLGEIRFQIQSQAPRFSGDLGRAILSIEALINANAANDEPELLPVSLHVRRFLETANDRPTPPTPAAGHRRSDSPQPHDLAAKAGR